MLRSRLLIILALTREARYSLRVLILVVNLPSITYVEVSNLGLEVLDLVIGLNRHLRAQFSDLSHNFISFELHFTNAARQDWEICLLAPNLTVDFS